MAISSRRYFDDYACIEQLSVIGCHRISHAFEFDFASRTYWRKGDPGLADPIIAQCLPSTNVCRSVGG
ncbi:MAG TPA: hypothetical protein DDZ51_12455 [Planctomycetaceae bacterium]|nr:hypothetical protein [Planctomycetaceae bacterium]